jgi:uncharacterized protein YegP (UPF0339 family)
MIFRVYEEGGEWRWRMETPSGDTILRSTEAFATKAHGVVSAELMKRRISRSPIEIADECIRNSRLGYQLEQRLPRS